ncbi:hypothetical protein SDC9_188544 [bioreactor metagenome]|jgi:hypothetical protein|uniref:Uncharacterized protein n=1 Tax=bioreactor metagenome TaxID=1076179 RepID=A0A645HXV6_9ZZZZ
MSLYPGFLYVGEVEFRWQAKHIGYEFRLILEGCAPHKEKRCYGDEEKYNQYGCGQHLGCSDLPMSSVHIVSSLV